MLVASIFSSQQKNQMNVFPKKQNYYFNQEFNCNSPEFFCAQSRGLVERQHKREELVMSAHHFKPGTISLHTHAHTHTHTYPVLLIFPTHSLWCEVRWAQLDVQPLKDREALSSLPIPISPLPRSPHPPLHIKSRYPYLFVFFHKSRCLMQEIYW